MLDGADPQVIDDIRRTAAHVAEVVEVTEVRARWLGHRLHAEINIAVNPQMTIAQAHAVATEVRHQLLHHLSYLSLVVIHVDPADHVGRGTSPHRRARARRASRPHPRVGGRKAALTDVMSLSSLPA